MITPYHAKYFAYELTKQGGKGLERLSRSLFDACVDLNPHQIDAALFAIRSPIQKGAILADEVGLGKTIEAGLVLCQLWAEKKRHILIICPASLRKQWALELEEKFNIPCLVLDAKSYREFQNNGRPNPFESDKVVITSIHFASRKAEEIKLARWNMTVIDEAHKLRNAYRQSNRMGQNIRWALEDSRKMLLTATPLQNSLLELYGLSTIIDERLFGDLPSFRSQFVNVGGDLDELRNRLNQFCIRTLRRQVVEYIQYTNRQLITRPFKPSEQEHKLYEAVSTFLQKKDSYALPAQQKHLTILIVRKLLASSPLAVAATLETMRDRLIAMRDNIKPKEDIIEEIISEEEMEEDILDELLDDIEEEEATSETESTIDRARLEEEIRDLDRFASWARSIGVDTKTKSLLKALDIGFKQLKTMKAKPKAVIFTESRRTQQYLKEFLENNGYVGQVCTFNGTNTDPDSKQIYETWYEKNRESGRATGSKPIDVRTAIIEHFEDTANIMIATEAAAEGINLQFCSLVVNFDLPWNPQRIEQRIGRCHRYGQKYDVVVINFLNTKNHADQRVYELLNEKFSLFSGVFGASDEVLGSIESGVDFERRILDIYQKCRTTEEIEEAFKKLQQELDETITTRIDDTRQKLLEHFDEDVHARLKVNLEGANQQLDKVSKLFWLLTQFILSDKASFDQQSLTFNLQASPVNSVRPGLYYLISKRQENVPGEFLYRLSHPLGEYVIESGKGVETQTANVTFDISNHPTRISMVEALIGKSGWLSLELLVIDSFEREEYLLFSGFDEDGKALDQETCEKLFNCSAEYSVGTEASSSIESKLNEARVRHAKATISRSLEINNSYFNEAREKLEKWADDMVLAAEKELKDTKAQIKSLNREARVATTVDEQHKIQDKIRDLERQKRKQRQQIFEVEDQIMAKRDNLIDELEKRMTQKTERHHLYTICWKVT